jgi:hypothetical protein
MVTGHQSCPVWGSFVVVVVVVGVLGVDVVGVFGVVGVGVGDGVSVGGV